MQPEQASINAEPRDARGRFAKGRSAIREAGPAASRTRQKARLRWYPERGSFRYAIDRARDGHRLALQPVLSDLLPKPRSAPIRFDLPPIRTASDAAPAIGEITAAAARGEIASAEGLELSRRVERRMRAIAKAAERESGRARPGSRNAMISPPRAGI